MDAIPPPPEDPAPPAPPPAPRRRRRRADAPPRDPAPAPRRRLHLAIDEESYERLQVHALRRRATPSVVVAGLIQEHLRDYIIHRNPHAQPRSDQAT